MNRPLVALSAALALSSSVSLAANTLTTVDSSPNGVAVVGLFSTVAIGADGLPVISYATEGGFKVAKCIDVACAMPALIKTIASSVSTGPTWLAIGQDGLPIITLQYEQTVRFARCANVNCTSGTSSIIDNVIPEEVAIAVGGDGLPAIGYLRFSLASPTVMVARCVDASCNDPPTLAAVDLANRTAFRSMSMAIGADGFPMMSYGSALNGAATVADCLNATCTNRTLVTLGDTPVSSTSIARSSDGFPIVSHIGGDPRALRVTKCYSAGCTGTVTTSIVEAGDADVFIAYTTGVAIGDDGNPVVAYTTVEGPGFTDFLLKVAKCANPACSSLATVTVVDDHHTDILDVSIALGDDGLPVLSYNRNPDELRVAKCGTPSCTLGAPAELVFMDGFEQISSRGQL